MQKVSATRGDGILENLLSNLRAKKANDLIPKSVRDGKILDVGCGSYPNMLLRTKFKEKFGIDPSLVSTSIENITLIKADITKESLPFADNFFDAVTMLAVFEHMEKDRIVFVLNQVKRVLKPNGTFVITTPAPWSDKLLHSMSKLGLISSEEIHEHKSHYGMNDIKKIIVNSGFDPSSIKSGYFEVGLNMWFQIKK